MKLSEKIIHLRSQASFLYDAGKQKGMSNESIADVIRPLILRLEKDIKQSSIKDKAQAIKALDGQIEAFMNDIQYAQSKIEETQGYIQKIKLSLIDDIGDHGHVEDSGYIVTNVNGQINIR